MRRCAFQFFLLGAIFSALASSVVADLIVGKAYSLRFVDIDGNKLSTADGHVSIVVLITRQNLSKSELVGDRVPDFCLGSPAYRMITVVKFGKHSAPVRAFLIAGAKLRLNNEARRGPTAL